MVQKRQSAARLLAVAALVAVVAALGACVGVPPRDANQRLQGQIKIIATRSLNEVASALAVRFETANPGVQISLTLFADPGAGGGSDEQQDADVVLVDGASALQAFDLTEAPTAFAANQLVIAVAAGNPLGLSRLADLARPGLAVALCQSGQPCGEATGSMLAKARVTVSKAIRVPDTRAGLDLVAAGDAAAAVVYRTDSRLAEDRVSTVEVGQAGARLITHHAAVLSGSAHPAVAKAFVAYLRSDEAATRLRSAGFQLPSTATSTTMPP